PSRDRKRLHILAAPPTDQTFVAKTKGEARVVDMATGQVLLQIDLTSEPSGDGQLQWTTMSEDGQWLVTATASWPKGDGSKHVKLHVQDVDGKRPATDIEVATGYVAGPFLSAEAGTIGILRKELGKGFWVEFWDL